MHTSTRAIIRLSARLILLFRLFMLTPRRGVKARDTRRCELHPVALAFALFTSSRSSHSLVTTAFDTTEPTDRNRRIRFTNRAARFEGTLARGLGSELS